MGLIIFVTIFGLVAIMIIWFMLWGSSMTREAAVKKGAIDLPSAIKVFFIINFGWVGAILKFLGRLCKKTAVFVWEIIRPRKRPPPTITLQTKNNKNLSADEPLTEILVQRENEKIDVDNFFLNNSGKDLNMKNERIREEREEFELAKLKVAIAQTLKEAAFINKETLVMNEDILDTKERLFKKERRVRSQALGLIIETRELHSRAQAGKLNYAPLLEIGCQTEDPEHKDKNAKHQKTEVSLPVTQA